MNRLSARERKLVALGLLVLAFAVAWFAVISPIADGFVQRAEARRNLLATYQRNQRLLDAMPTWRAQAETQKRSAASYAIVAPSQAQGQDLLNQRVATAISFDGAAPPTVQDLQADIPPGWVGARADAQLTLPQLVASLRRLESEEPYVVVQRLSISAEQAFHTGRAGPLDVRLEVSAAFRPANPGQL
ncbi:MAG TPA: type II secretion system protein GspM [Caulobacteraceae bacterium]|jgi:general secretion pathway protein M|nr:type II secretion system protein GspM [Caulobacteraceae bacterium]